MVGNSAIHFGGKAISALGATDFGTAATEALGKTKLGSGILKGLGKAGEYVKPTARCCLLETIINIAYCLLTILPLEALTQPR